MAKIIKKRAKKVGMPPGSLIYVGEKAAREPKVTIIYYDEQTYEEQQVSTMAQCLAFKNDRTVAWINVDGLQHLGNLQMFGDCFHLHPLILEDILNTDQRPKLEDLGDYLYLVFKMLNYQEETRSLDMEQISLVLGKNYVITFHESDEDIFRAIKERLKSGIGRLRREGADYLAYALLDVVVDQYFLILEKMGEDIEFLEEELVSRPGQTTLQQIHKLKTDMILLRKATWPLREVVSRMQRRESPLIREATLIYLKDVYDHAIQIIDTVETFRDMLAAMLDIYLSSVSNRLNEIMKVLTIIATIFIPLTYIAGVYGMNFKNMPELEWTWGYPAVLALMGGVAGIMLMFFRRRGWLGRDREGLKDGRDGSGSRP